ncbi:MAG: hypothetical protein U0002_18810 [Thermoanaerobaculia bacterium]
MRVRMVFSLLAVGLVSAGVAAGSAARPAVAAPRFRVSVVVLPAAEDPGRYRAWAQVSSLGEPGRVVEVGLELGPGRILSVERLDEATHLALRLEAVATPRDGLASYRLTVSRHGEELLEVAGRVELPTAS